MIYDVLFERTNLCVSLICLCLHNFIGKCILNKKGLLPSWFWFVFLYFNSHSWPVTLFPSCYSLLSSHFAFFLLRWWTIWTSCWRSFVETGRARKCAANSYSSAETLSAMKDYRSTREQENHVWCTKTTSGKWEYCMVSLSLTCELIHITSIFLNLVNPRDFYHVINSDQLLLMQSDVN